MTTAHRIALDSLLSNSLANMDRALFDALESKEADVTLEALGLDSLGRLELSIFLSTQLKMEVTEADLHEVNSFVALSNFISKLVK